MARSHLSYSLAVIPVFGSTALRCDATFNMCSNDTLGTSGDLSCTDGQVAAIQSSLVFLSSCLTSAEVSRPKKTVSTQQSLTQILDYLTPSAVDLDPHSCLSSLLFLSGMLHLQSCSPTEYTINSSWSLPPAHLPMRFSSLILGLEFHHWYLRTHSSLSVPPQDLIHRISAPRLEHLVLMEINREKVFLTP